MAQPKRLGDQLLEKGIINQDQLEIALYEQRRSGKRLGEVLFSLGFLTPEQLQESVSESVGVSSLDLTSIVPDAEALALLDERFARSYKVLPIDYDKELKRIRVAAVNPDDIMLVDRLRRQIGAGISVVPVLANERDIGDAIDQYYGYELSIEGILKELESGEINLDTTGLDEYAQPMVRLVDSLLTDAVKRGASDIHFEPEEFFVRIRYRIDGVLRQVRLLQKGFWSAMLVRLKVISHMDIAESRLPQDGRIGLTVSGRKIDFRASSQPTSHGENFVLRILDREKGIVPLDKLDLDPESHDQVRLMISRPTGITIVTGPTGSGKTTTLYSILNELNKVDVNIMTLEDPVEYPMTMIRQTSINEAAGMDFAAGIRSLMRQDPDIILLGEIRDQETAEMAVRAAMTGHKVFATLHANSAMGAIPRLLDIGIKPTILSTNIAGIVAQRLVRRLCEHCKKPHPAEPFERQLLGVGDSEPLDLYEPDGCDYCNLTGYRGRVAIMETVRFDSEMDDMLIQQASYKELQDVANRKGFFSLADAGIRRVLRGETSLDELGRVVDLTDRLM
ncbi:GspE/PulE family protein [Marinobacterium arenosum]|uniref:GspE/PulE family protein n=1 Tax=Marinobacterium arenosum TaxID=2862496 RepID=UPI001C989249|nr:type II/IV secretion system protein [Marinobacterium arenosum]MBY4676530.1 Flp pilus assembly complex ATPase component TadA [Marinobacterium arenosum]